MLPCCTCKLATRPPSGFCSSGADELFVDAHVYQFMFRSMSGVFVWKWLLPQGYKCNQYSVSYFLFTGFTAWLTSGSEKHSYRVLGCGTLKPQISDLFLLRNPNIVWLFLSLSALFDSRQKWVHRKGKWVTVTSVLSHTGGVEVAFNLTECSRCLKVYRKYGRRVQRKSPYQDIRTTESVSCTLQCSHMKCVSSVLIGLMYCVGLNITVTIYSCCPHLSSVCCSLSLSALPLPQDGKPKSMCSIVESTVQSVSLSTLNTTKTTFRNEIFLESSSFCW